MWIKVCRVDDMADVGAAPPNLEPGQDSLVVTTLWGAKRCVIIKCERQVCIHLIYIFSALWLSIFLRGGSRHKECAVVFLNGPRISDFDYSLLAANSYQDCTQTFSMCKYLKRLLRFKNNIFLVVSGTISTTIGACAQSSERHLDHGAAPVSYQYIACLSNSVLVYVYYIALSSS